MVELGDRAQGGGRQPGLRSSLEQGGRVPSRRWVERAADVMLMCRERLPKEQ